MVVLSVSFVVAVGIGPASIAPEEVVRILAHQVGLATPSGPAVQETILLDVRLPRVILGAMVGAGLSVVGVVLQALVRNPLADPHIIGVSAGASVGATAVIVLGINTFGIYSLSAAAFVGALVALVLVYFLAQHSGRLSPLRLILAGVAISFLFAAVTSFLIFSADNANAVRSATFWLLGGLGAARWSYVTLPVVAVVAGTLLLALQSRSLDAIMMGDDTAASLGVDPSRFRKQLFVVAALIAGLLVAVAGGIGFVALMIPHMARILVGSSHRRLLPVAALGGAAFLVWADVGARMLFAPEELPIGVITAFCGAPFFLWLMRSRDASRRVV
ncbi:MAG: iron ABC transporter permease [Chloroflexota bacterium]|nr:iron ABC transporter permease [Chloroflexota bacterium]